MYDFDKVDPELLRKQAYQKWGRAQGDVISLSTADMDFPIAGEIKDGVRKALDSDRTFYGNVQGDEDVLEAIRIKLKNKNRIEANIEDIYVIPGATFGIFLACWQILKPGDEAIVTPSPVHGSFYSNITNVKGKIVYNNINPADNKLDIADLKRRITRRTRLLMVCNPHNPTGRVFTKEELAGIASLAKRHNLAVLSDELYEDLVYEGEHISISSLDEDIAKRTLTVFGFSKAFNMAGLRVAYIVCEGEIMKELKTKIASTIVHTDRLAQAAARAALTESASWFEGLRQHLLSMRNYSMERIKSLPGVKCSIPQAGLFLFLDVKSYGMKSCEMADYLAKKARVLVVPGVYFGPAGEGYIRINFATSKSILKEAFDRIESALTHIFR